VDESVIKCSSPLDVLNILNLVHTIIAVIEHVHMNISTFKMTDSPTARRDAAGPARLAHDRGAAAAAADAADAQVAHDRAAVDRRRGARRARAGGVALNVKVILTPPCIILFH
jgi:hypothetical protein